MLSNLVADLTKAKPGLRVPQSLSSGDSCPRPGLPPNHLAPFDRIRGRVKRLCRCASSGMVILLLCSTSYAGPLDWVKHHKRFLLMEGAAITGASIHAYGLRHCRKFGVERCDEHYGEAWAMFGITTGLTTIVAPSVAESCWKDESGKYCGLLSYVPSTAQASWGVHEYSLGYKHKENDSRARTNRF